MVAYTLDKKKVNVGANFAVAYTCKLQEDEWKCVCTDENTCGNWMLQDYIVNKDVLPTTPEGLGNPSNNNNNTNESANNNGQEIGDVIGFNATNSTGIPNECDGYDLNNDGSVSPVDALIIINEISDPTLTNYSTCEVSNFWCNTIDVDKNGEIAEADSEIIINAIETCEN